jgi:hypothetical protein
MNKFNYKKLIPYIAALFIFISISYAYFPEVLSGKIVNQADVSAWRGATNEILNAEKETGEKPLWTNSMFGGMPSYMISADFKGNKTKSIYNALLTGKRPATYICMAMISFFLLLMAFGVNPWLGIIGAIAFGFSSYNMIIIQVGHNSKMMAIAYMPMVLGAMVYAYRKNRILGSILLGLALALEIVAKHPQITYYLGLVLLIYGCYELYAAYRSKKLSAFAKTSAMILVATLMAVATNADYLLTMKEYSKYTMRGPSELTHDAHNKTATGIDKDYATAWSYGIDETFNLLIPNYKGGASVSELSEESEIYKLFAQQDPAYAKKVIKQMPTYWGTQPGTSGPVYIGSIMIFLFVLGLFLVRGRTKWWLLTCTLLSFALAWGHHFMPLTDFFLDYVPMYNKFRTVSMILVIAQLCIPLLAILALKRVFDKEIEKKELIKGLKIALGTTGGFCLLIALFPSIAGDFVGGQDAQMQEVILNALRADRMSMLKADAFRSLIFILLSAGTLFFVIKDKLKNEYAYIILAALVLIDMWSVDKRYLNKDHFMPKRNLTGQFQERPVDQMILQDKDPNYKVLDLTVSTFNNSQISYYHKTIGGYSAGKLRRYQDLIEFHIAPEMNTFIEKIQKANTLTELDTTMMGLNVLNMLNTKYIVTSANNPAIQNRFALGNAWFVDDYKMVDNADAEIAALKSFNPREEAIIDKSFENILKNRAFAPDRDASIKLLSYAPDKIVYKSKANAEQLAVFSEIYYSEGWKVSVDNKEAEHFRANYILRSMIVPKGEHTIKFYFEPDTYYTGKTIASISSILLILLFIAGMLWRLNIYRKE